MYLLRHVNYLAHGSAHYHRLKVGRPTPSNLRPIGHRSSRSGARAAAEKKREAAPAGNTHNDDAHHSATAGLGSRLRATLRCSLARGALEPPFRRARGRQREQRPICREVGTSRTPSAAIRVNSTSPAAPPRAAGAPRPAGPCVHELRDTETGRGDSPRDRAPRCPLRLRLSPTDTYAVRFLHLRQAFIYHGRPAITQRVR